MLWAKVYHDENKRSIKQVSTKAENMFWRKACEGWADIYLSLRACVSSIREIFMFCFLSFEILLYKEHSFILAYVTHFF